MVYNIDADNGRAREPGDGVLPGSGLGADIHRDGLADSSGQSSGQSSGHPSGQVRTEEVEEGVQNTEVRVNPYEEWLASVFARWREKFHDVPDDRFNRVVEDLRVPLSISSIARSLIEEGYGAHLSPITVRTRLTKFRDAMGWPKYSEQIEAPEPAAKEDEPDEPIEGEPALKRLRWLTRIQHARVRKGLKLEGQLGGMNLATTADDIKLMSDLLDKELAIQLKTGEVKAAPQQVKLDIPGIPIHEPAEAMRVVLAYRKIKSILAERAAALPPPTGGGEKKAEP